MAILCVNIRKGLDIPLEGPPRLECENVPLATRRVFYPADFAFQRARTSVAIGQSVSRGDVLFYDRKNEALKFRSPVSGRVTAITLGARRTIEHIAIEADFASTAVGNLRRYTTDQIERLSQQDVVQHLCDTGALALIEQRPFAVRAEPAAHPKSVFINGMNTAPFTPDIRILVEGEEAAFQAGLTALAQVAPHRAFLCLDGRVENFPTIVKQPRNAAVIYFKGPHPSGNSSVHIHYVDPIKPGDVVWTVSAAAVIQIGYAFLDGTLSPTRIVSLGGPAVREAARKYYRVPLGAEVDGWLADKLADGETRRIAGDVLSGRILNPSEPVRLQDFAFTALREGRERRYLGWIMPGLDQYSRSSSFISWWLRRGTRWALDTNLHGSRRAMVLTGLYDQYLPLNIMADFLIRAILARDYEEAIQLGLLEIAPEDFALPAFVCPSKMDLVGIVRQGLTAARQEGF